MDRDIGRAEESVMRRSDEEDDLNVAGLVSDVDISESSRMKVPLLFRL